MPDRHFMSRGIDPISLARAAAEHDASYSTFSDLIESELETSGLAFAVSDKKLQENYYRALGSLLSCVRTSPSGRPMLIEGGVYRGAWLESTATASAEILCRFLPSVARSTFELFAEFRREDGLIPYKILPPGPDSSPGGPSYRQVQMVTPLARSVWIHSSLNHEGEAFLRMMYEAMAANDAWLAANRDTRHTGCVEAFCAFDTGHDLSPRFWHVPDTCYMEDPARYDPSSPLLPYLAPDMTANVYCQRLYLSRIASSLGLDGESASWKTKADRSLRSLMDSCWHEEDGFFYDVDSQGRFVRIQSDVLLRVLACEVGDDELFASSCSRYLLNTRKFFARFPFTSIAMDDPRFDPASSYNTWGGATNTLSIIRAGHAFEAHGRHAELCMVLGRALAAYSRMKHFGQCISPYTGEEGYTSAYSPTLLGFMDSVERFIGILPRPDGSLWFSCLPLPAGVCDRAESATTVYTRRVNGRLFELECSPDGACAYMDGESIFSCPRGLRVETDGEGRVLSLIGMLPTIVEGRFESTTSSSSAKVLTVSAAPDEVLRFTGSSFESIGGPAFIAPVY